MKKRTKNSKYGYVIYFNLSPTATVSSLDSENPIWIEEIGDDVHSFPLTPREMDNLVKWWSNHKRVTRRKIYGEK